MDRETITEYNFLYYRFLFWINNIIIYSEIKYINDIYIVIQVVFWEISFHNLSKIKKGKKSNFDVYETELNLLLRYWLYKSIKSLVLGSNNWFVVNRYE